MEYKVEKFQKGSYSPPLILPKNGTQEETWKSNKSTTVSNKSSTQFIEGKSSESTVEKNVVLNLCPDGSKFSININGTTLKATKTSLRATIGCFTINIDSLIQRLDAPLQHIVEVINSEQGHPLHIVLPVGDLDSPVVKANLSSSKFLKYIYFLKSIIYFLLCMNS